MIALSISSSGSIGSDFADLTRSGSLMIAIPVAMLAGLVSFFSPCVVPLLPGYLSFATGLSGADLESAKRGRMALGGLLFVLGFSVIFVAFGAAFGALGDWLADYRHQRLLAIILGAITILLGLAFMGLVPWLQRDVRVHRVPAVGLAAAPMLGALFGLGWTPCVGPTLTAVMGLAANEATATRGALLAFAYCLGLGIPFILAGLAWRHALGTVKWVRRHQVWVTRLGGALLIVVGLLLITGWWDVFVADIRDWFFPGFNAGI